MRTLAALVLLGCALAAETAVAGGRHALIVGTNHGDRRDVSLQYAERDAERIAEIRVHGNHTTPEADILTLAGLSTGLDASEARLKLAEQKLENTGRFEGVELRRRVRVVSALLARTADR